MSISEMPLAAKAGYHHGDLKAQLVEAVRRLVEDKGPDAFSIAEASRLAGVSTAAPYKHFKDKPAILQAVALDGMERLHRLMEDASAPLPKGSRARVNAIGQAYIDFAKAEPGVFRLVFGLTEGHQEDEALKACGKECHGVILGAVADCLGLRPDDADVNRRAYILWTFVHGHSFLTIDNKLKQKEIEVDEATYLDTVSRGILPETVSGS